MRTWIKRAGFGLAGLGVVLAAGALWKREELMRLHAVNTLFAPERIVSNFSHMDRAFLTAPLPAASGGMALESCDSALSLPPEAEAWLETAAVTGLVVLRDNCIAHETYRLGTAPEDRRISWSVAKSALSLLTGVLVEEGALALDEPVTLHAPGLAGSAYDGATVEDVLQMESGVRFDEDYLDRDSDINRMGREIALGGSLDGFTAALTEREADPGARMRYVSMDTHVLGMVLRGATGRAIPDLLSDRILGPIGADDGYYLTDGDGTAFVLGGLNLTTRDYARLGKLVANDGLCNGRQIVPAAWIERSTAPSALTGPSGWRYGYQWWVAPEDAGDRPGEVIGRGVYGQYLLIDRARDVVVAVNAADRSFREPGAQEAALTTLRAIADATEYAPSG